MKGDRGSSDQPNADLNPLLMIVLQLRAASPGLSLMLPAKLCQNNFVLSLIFRFPGLELKHVHPVSFFFFIPHDR